MAFSKKIIATSMGADHVLFLTREGEIFGLGQNDFKQITSSKKDIIVEPNLLVDNKYFESVPKPTQIKVDNLDPDEKVVGISAGRYNSFILTSKGRVFACGDNRLNEISSTDEKIIASPTLVDSDKLPDLDPDEKIIDIQTNVGQIDSQQSNQIFLTSKGRIFARGENHHGEFGEVNIIGTTVLKPVEIKLNDLDDNEKVIKAVPGSDQTIFITSAGRVYILGKDYISQSDSLSQRSLLFEGLEKDEKILDVNSPCAVSTMFVTSKGNIYGSKRYTIPSRTYDKSISEESTLVKLDSDVCDVYYSPKPLLDNDERLIAASIDNCGGICYTTSKNRVLSYDLHGYNWNTPKNHPIYPKPQDNLPIRTVNLKAPYYPGYGWFLSGLFSVCDVIANVCTLGSANNPISRAIHQTIDEAWDKKHVIDSAKDYPITSAKEEAIINDHQHINHQISSKSSNGQSESDQHQTVEQDNKLSVNEPYSHAQNIQTHGIHQTVKLSQHSEEHPPQFSSLADGTTQHGVSYQPTQI